MPRNDDRGIEHLPLSHSFIRQIKNIRRVLAKAFIGPGKTVVQFSLSSAAASVKLANLFLHAF
jgi:hypothetical protein